MTNFINQLTVPSLQVPNTSQTSAAASFFETDTSQTEMGSHIKKKKLTGYSRSASNLPQINFNDSTNIHHSFNVAPFTNDDEFTRNISNSSYNSSYSNTASTSGISSSSSYNNNLTGLLKDDNSRRANKLTPSGKHLKIWSNVFFFNGI